MKVFRTRPTAASATFMSYLVAAKDEAAARRLLIDLIPRGEKLHEVALADDPRAVNRALRLDGVVFKRIEGAAGDWRQA